MAGRLFRIVLVCAVSGLLITALAQIKSLNSFHKKPAAIGDFQLSLDDDHLKTGQMGDSDWRSSLKTTLPETDSILQNHAKAPQGAAERSIRKEKRYDPALGISVESLMARQKASVGVTLVDVRDQRAFQQCRIPGSINVPLYALKTKKFLVSTFVVLTNEGFPCTRLAEQCRQLRASGYMVWILEGGLNAWSEAGAPLEGEQPAQNDLNRLSLGIFLKNETATAGLRLMPAIRRNRKRCYPSRNSFPWARQKIRKNSLHHLWISKRKERGSLPALFWSSMKMESNMRKWRR